MPPDEHPWIERFGCTAHATGALRDGIRDVLPRALPADRRGAGARRSSTPATAASRKLCHEPRVALAVLEGMLAPRRAAARLLLEHAPGRGRASTATASRR